MYLPPAAQLLQKRLVSESIVVGGVGARFCWWLLLAWWSLSHLLSHAVSSSFLRLRILFQHAHALATITSHCSGLPANNHQRPSTIRSHDINHSYVSQGPISCSGIDRWQRFSKCQPRAQPFNRTPVTGLPEAPWLRQDCENVQDASLDLVRQQVDQAGSPVPG